MVLRRHSFICGTNSNLRTLRDVFVREAGVGKEWKPTPAGLGVC